MTGKFLPKGSIYEVSFGFHSKMGGYTTLMSDMPKLGDIAASIIRFKYQYYL